MSNSELETQVKKIKELWEKLDALPMYNIGDAEKIHEIYDSIDAEVARTVELAEKLGYYIRSLKDPWLYISDKATKAVEEVEGILCRTNEGAMLFIQAEKIVSTAGVTIDETEHELINLVTEKELVLSQTNEWDDWDDYRMEDVYRLVTKLMLREEIEEKQGPLDFEPLQELTRIKKKLVIAREQLTNMARAKAIEEIKNSIAICKKEVKELEQKENPENSS